MLTSSENTGNTYFLSCMHASGSFLTRLSRFLFLFRSSPDGIRFSNGAGSNRVYRNEIINNSRYAFYMCKCIFWNAYVYGRFCNVWAWVAIFVVVSHIKILSVPPLICYVFVSLTAVRTMSMPGSLFIFGTAWKLVFVIFLLVDGTFVKQWQNAMFFVTCNSR